VNVLFLTHRLPYAPNRGDRIRAYHLLKHLSTFARVSLFSLVHDAEEQAEAQRMPFAADVAVARVTRIRNLARGLARIRSATPLTHSLLDSCDAIPAIARLVRANPPDVVPPAVAVPAEAVPAEAVPAEAVPAAATVSTPPLTRAIARVRRAGVMPMIGLLLPASVPRTRKHPFG